MKGIVVYGSNYGTTRAYAQELARRTGWPAVDWQQAQKLADYEAVVYLGGLYAGGVVGLKAVLPQLEQVPAQKLVVVTVGVADPAEPENVAHIRASLQKQLPGALYQKAQFAHLRGGIDYSRLNFKAAARSPLSEGAVCPPARRHRLQPLKFQTPGDDVGDGPDAQKETARAAERGGPRNHPHL